ncbi:hypothetical protein [Arcanobacterium phocae]|uniref:hypothetical protein n=2 Tax=Arcanobacterium phocae TaxID=131112 RepID=UPI001C0EFC61|nr:hypothetical protein [Arcanobacterium phocae]
MAWVMNKDLRYENLVKDLWTPLNLPFEERVLLSTSRFKIALALKHGEGCREDAISHLGVHLLVAEIDEHDSRKINLNELIEFEQHIYGETLRKLKNWPPRGRYHYDIYRLVCEELSVSMPVSCGLRLRAAALMMPLR